MAKKRELICHYCKNYFDRETMIQVTKSKRACVKCNENMVRDKKEYKELVEYLCIGLNLKAPTGFMLKSIKKIKELGYSYKDIQWTIYYMASVRRMRLTDGCVNLVPNYFTNMIEYRKILDNARNSKIEKVHESIVVKYTHIRKAKINNTRLIDIEKIQ